MTTGLMARLSTPNHEAVNGFYPVQKRAFSAFVRNTNSEFEQRHWLENSSHTCVRFLGVKDVA
jgi:hypothetical protein